MCWPLARELHEQSPSLCCTSLCDAVPEADYLNLHGLNVCSGEDVISNASFLPDGAYRAEWEAVVCAEGSRGPQHKAEVLRLEEEPSKKVLSLKPVCCETAAELIRAFLPFPWPWQLIPAPPPASLWPCCVLCVPGPQVGSLGGSKAWEA